MQRAMLGFEYQKGGFKLGQGMHRYSSLGENEVVGIVIYRGIIR